MCHESLWKGFIVFFCLFPALPVTLTGVPLLALRFCGSVAALRLCRTSRQTTWWRKAQNSQTHPSPPPPPSSWSHAPSPVSPHAAGARTPRYVPLIQPHLLGSSLVLHQPQSFYNITSAGKNRLCSGYDALLNMWNGLVWDPGSYLPPYLLLSNHSMWLWFGNIAIGYYSADFGHWYRAAAFTVLHYPTHIFFHHFTIVFL